MQKFKEKLDSPKDSKLETIYFSWHELKKVYQSSHKKLLRHYLTSIEFMTRTSFFQKHPIRVAPSEFCSINKNAFKGLHEEYLQTASLEITRGANNQVMYKFPSHYPQSIDSWKSLKGGFLKLKREELKALLETLNDNELRLYFVLRRIQEATKDSRTGVETWYKVLRSSHLNISQNTLKKLLESLTEKGLLCLAWPIEKAKRLQNRFIFCLKKICVKEVSKELSNSFQENETEFSQFPENLEHLNENILQSGNYLNQSAGENLKVEDPLPDHSDFDFYGLENLDRPLDKRTFEVIVKDSGLSREEVKESLYRFSRYYFSHEDNQRDYKNPVGFIRHHLITFKQMFIEPEWWLHSQGKVHLGKGRFSKRQMNKDSETKLDKNFYQKVQVPYESKKAGTLSSTQIAESLKGLANLL